MIDASKRLDHLPVGLAAWVVEKFYAQRHHPGNLENRFAQDALQITVMVYWVTETSNTSVRPTRQVPKPRALGTAIVSLKDQRVGRLLL